jgi:hypothetical protein
MCCPSPSTTGWLCSSGAARVGVATGRDSRRPRRHDGPVRVHAQVFRHRDSGQPCQARRRRTAISVAEEAGLTMKNSLLASPPPTLVLRAPQSGRAPATTWTRNLLPRRETGLTDDVLDASTTSLRPAWSWQHRRRSAHPPPCSTRRLDAAETLPLPPVRILEIHRRVERDDRRRSRPEPSCGSPDATGAGLQLLD